MSKEEDACCVGSMSKDSSDLNQSVVEKFLPFVELGSSFEKDYTSAFLVKFGVSPILHMYPSRSSLVAWLPEM